jgi:hypothetical protein
VASIITPDRRPYAIFVDSISDLRLLCHGPEQYMCFGQSLEAITSHLEKFALAPAMHNVYPGTGLLSTRCRDLGTDRAIGKKMG